MSHASAASYQRKVRTKGKQNLERRDGRELCTTGLVLRRRRERDRKLVMTETADGARLGTINFAIGTQVSRARFGIHIEDLAGASIFPLPARLSHWSPGSEVRKRPTKIATKRLLSDVQFVRFVLTNWMKASLTRQPFAYSHCYVFKRSHHPPARSIPALVRDSIKESRAGYICLMILSAIQLTPCAHGQFCKAWARVLRSGINLTA